jgi:hydrophobic/amphiphilic exporter-1 (mainly G- bacteria), HAE1 family
MVNLAINRPVLVIVFILVLLIFGGMAYFTLSINMMPDVNIPYVVIQTVYPGSSPREVETQITKKVEDAVSTISKIDFIESYSMEGASLVVMKFKLGKDVDIALRDVKDKVDAIQSEFPDDAKRPTIYKYEMGSQPIAELVLTGSVTSQELYDIADKKLKDRLSQIEGVAKVDVSGGQKREIQIALDRDTAEENGVSLTMLDQLLTAGNLDLPGGHFVQEGQEYTVRLGGQYASVVSMPDLDVPTRYGVKKLRQLADVRDLGAEVRQKSYYYNSATKKTESNVVRISVVKSSDGNAVDVAAQVKNLLPGLQEQLPRGVTLDLADDSSIFIKASVDDTISNLYMGIILTGLILLLFLHDLRSTLIVAITMPTSVIATFIMLQLHGYSLNIMTLMGLSTAVGTLVTNSIVVLENIFRHKAMGNDRKEAARKGTSEIAIAVVASALTNIAVFLPIASMQTMIGQMLKEFALTVTYATLFSLVVSFTLTPMLAARILPKEEKTNAFGRAFDGMFDWINRYYRALLTWLFTSRWKAVMVIVIPVIVLILSFGLVTSGKIGFEFIPTLDEGNIEVDIELPQGYGLDETAKVFEQAQAVVSTHPEVLHVVTTLGELSEDNTGSNLAKMDVKLVDTDQRKMSTNELNNLLLKDLAAIPNARIRSKVLNSIGGGGGSAVELYLYGQDVDKLEEIKSQVFAKMKDVPGLLNFDSSSRSGAPEISLYPRRDVMAHNGVTVYELAMALRASMEGSVSTTYKENGEEYDIRVMLKDESVDSPSKVEGIPVVTSAGVMRMAQLADVKYTEGVNKITRRDKYKVIQFTGDNAFGVPLGNVTKVIQSRLDTISLPDGYRFKWSGMAEMMNDTVSDMARTFMLAILLTFLLLSAILESFAQPLIILFTLPLALIGVFGALYLSGVAMNMFSMLAIVMLVGIVVNNAILQLDYTNQLKREGRTCLEALLEACSAKLKPIIMSSLAIIVSTLPMAMGIGSAGKEFRQALGVVTIGGIIVSTVLTLVVIPAMYYLTTHTADRKSVEKTGD